MGGLVGLGGGDLAERGRPGASRPPAAAPRPTPSAGRWSDRARPMRSVRHGIRPALVPDRFVAEGLLEVFPRPPVGRRRPGARRPGRGGPPGARRRTAGRGLGGRRRRGLPHGAGRPGRGAARRGGLRRTPSLFTSGSTVDGVRRRPAGAGVVPRVVVAIGPVTAGGADAHGLAVAAVADPALARGPGRRHGGRRWRDAPARAVDALVFDLDGTIADTESVEYDAIRLVWADHGLDYPIERWAHVVGQSWSPAWVTELVGRGGRRRRPGRRPRQQEPLPRRAARRARAPPGRGRADRRRLGGGHPAGRRVELGLGLGRVRPGAARPALQFVAITTIDRVEQGKPHPEPFLAACAAARRPAGPIRGLRGLDHRRGVGGRRGTLHGRLPRAADRRPRHRPQPIWSSRSLELDVTLAALETASGRARRPRSS